MCAKEHGGAESGHSQMSSWTLIKSLQHDNRRSMVEIRADPNSNLFRYYVMVWTSVDEIELLYHPDGGYWSCPDMSGYCSSLTECEVAVRARFDWAKEFVQGSR